MFFFLNTLEQISGDHSYVAHLVIQNLDIDNEHFQQIAENFPKIESITFIDCKVELDAKIGLLPLKELSFTNTGISDDSLNILNDLPDVEILTFIDTLELDLRYLQLIDRVKNLTLAYDELINSDECIEFIGAEFLDIRDTNIHLEELLKLKNLKHVIITKAQSEANSDVLIKLQEKDIKVTIE